MTITSSTPGGRPHATSERHAMSVRAPNQPKTWIQLVDGTQFWPKPTTPQSVSIEAIAMGLANACRFAGQCRFYSVGQHSVLASLIVPAEDALAALLHDVEEGLGLYDIPKPYKLLPELAGYCDLAARVRGDILESFGLSRDLPPSVKWADAILLATEARDLKQPIHPDWARELELATPLPNRIVPWTP